MEKARGGTRAMYGAPPACHQMLIPGVSGLDSATPLLLQPVSLIFKCWIGCCSSSEQSSLNPITNPTSACWFCYAMTLGH